MTETDAQHLKILSIIYYVFAGLTALFSLFPLIYVVVGAALLSNPNIIPPEVAQEIQGGGGSDVPLTAMAGVVLTMGLVGFILLVAGAVLNFLTGRWLGQRKHHLFCVVVAVLTLLNFPLGTILGIFTLMVLMRDSVKQAFQGNSGPPPQHFGSGGSNPIIRE